MIDEPYAASGAATTVTAFFDSRTEAEAAAHRLRALDLTGRVTVTEGAGGSGLTDAGTGSGSGTGSSPDDRGFFERLGDFLFPDEDRSTYAEGLSRGGHLVTVTDLAPADYDRAMDVLEDSGAVDIDERAESWRAEGWQSEGWQSGAAMSRGAGYATASAGTGGTEEEDETLPVVEERLRVGKRDVSHGRVRVRSYVVEEPVTETVHLESGTVEVERRRVDRPVGEAGDLFRERSIEAEEFREEAVVSKEARIVEEVGLRRRQEAHDETVSDTVRRTEVEVEDDRALTVGPGRSAERDGGMTEYEAETGEPDADDPDRDDPDATGLTGRR
jgi:uncharacterized protein (TIGR02271 family)